MLLALAGLLFSDPAAIPDLSAAVSGIRESLRQLQQDVKELRHILTELQRAEKKTGDPVKGESAPVPVVATSPRPMEHLQEAQQAYESGRRAEDSKEYSRAIESFTTAIALDPRNDSALLHRGYCYFGLGEYASAISDFSESLAVQPNSSRTFAARASVLAASGQPSAALSDADEAIRRDHENPGNYLLRAKLQRQLGHTEESIADFNEVIARVPDSADAYLGRAALLRAKGQIKESLADCYKAIQISPAQASPYLCRAQFYLLTGATAPALEDINYALMIGDNSSEIKTLLSMAQSALQTHVSSAAQVTGSPEPNQPTMQKPTSTESDENASSIMANAGPIDPANPGVATASHPVRGVNGLYREGRANLDKERFAAALEAFTLALLQDPANAQILNARGYAHLRLHHYEEAVADFTEALRIKPSYSNAYRNRSAAKKALGDRAGASQDLRRALESYSPAQAAAGSRQ